MPLTYCFAGSDIKAQWHVAFWERSGSPSWPPVHLHNVATCHMETGITNLCLSVVALCPSYPPSCPRAAFFPRFLFFVPLFCSYFLLVSFCHVLLRGLQALLKHSEYYHCGEEKKIFVIFTEAHTHKASGVPRGSRDRMSTPAVRTVVTGRGANTNVINTSALTPGTLCVSVFVLRF